MVTTSVTISDEITVKPRMSQSRTFAGKPDQDWTWADLRDYVVAEIEKRQGPLRRDSYKECGIFKGFLARWGLRAPAIARAAFERYDGSWAGEPIGILRFCKGSDPYFSTVIADTISDNRTKVW